MAELFADSSGWACWVDASQHLHTLAVLAVDVAFLNGDRIITTNWVLAELGALLSSPLRMPKPKQIAFIKNLRVTTWVEIVAVDSALEAAGWRLWENRSDKDWSPVDCVSFEIMRR